MTLIDKIVHYIFLLLFGPVLKLVYLSPEVEKKSDTNLHYIHPGPFDPYEILSTPGRSRGLLYKQPGDSLIKSVILFLPKLYGAAKPKRLKIALQVIK